MTAMELQQWKKNFVEDYLDEIDDLEVLENQEIRETRYAQEREPSSLRRSFARRNDCGYQKIGRRYKTRTYHI